MNSKILHTPEGVRDIYNEECQRKITLAAKVNDVISISLFKSYFLDTSAISFSSRFGLTYKPYSFSYLSVIIPLIKDCVNIFEPPNYLIVIVLINYFLKYIVNPIQE